MARIETCNVSSFPMEKLKNPVLIVVDMINGFVTEGPLADPAIGQIVQPIQELLEAGIPAWFICDHHNPDDAEFDSFPVHCLAGSQEAEVIDPLKPYVKRVLLKNTISAAAAPDYSRLLESIQKANDIIVTGCCTDLCVEQLALPLHNWIRQNNLKDKRVIVPVNAVETYHIPELHDAYFWNDVALKQMAANGIEVVSNIA